MGSSDSSCCGSHKNVRKRETDGDTIKRGRKTQDRNTDNPKRPLLPSNYDHNTTTDELEQIGELQKDKKEQINDNINDDAKKMEISKTKITIKEKEIAICIKENDVEQCQSLQQLTVILNAYNSL